jgi:hypothetical protein
MQPNILLLARIASLWHFTKAQSSIIACEGVQGRRVIEAICFASTYSWVPCISTTIRFRKENAHAIVFIAIGNVDTISIVVVVTVRAIPRITCPCYINLPDVVGATGIRVVVDLHLFRLCWADSQQNSQISKAEELHNGKIWRAVKNVRKQKHGRGFSRPTSFVCQDTVVGAAKERIVHRID